MGQVLPESVCVLYSLIAAGWAQVGRAEDCWCDCGRGGLCEKVCGQGGHCCRKGFNDCPDEAQEVAIDEYHTCVRQRSTGGNLETGLLQKLDLLLRQGTMCHDASVPYAR